MLMQHVRRSPMGCSLEEIPQFIKKIINENRWQRRYVKHLGELIEFDSFEEFITTAPPEGMDTTIQSIKDLCQHDLDAQKAIDEALQRPAGGNNNPEGIGGKSHKEIIDTFNNVKVDKVLAPVGNSPAAGLRRLRKDRPDLYEQVGKNMTVNQAMVEAGFRETPIQLNPTDPIKAAQTILKAIDCGKITREFWDRVFELTN